MAPISREETGGPCIEIPEEEESVFGDASRSWKLGKPLSSGGEGKVYDLKDGTAAKLYRPGKMDRFLDWRKWDTVQLSITILEKICALDGQGILLGDINPLNILVQSPTEVWFVDCDSYQIGRYPCPVGTERFTAPEIQNRKFSTFLRSRGNENFAIATLLFMIMLPGKSPYAQQGGENMGQLIRAMQFPYSCGDRHSANHGDLSSLF